MFKCDLYVQVFENHVRARNVDSGETVEIRPQNPFSHARALVGTFSEAEMVIKSAVKQVKGFTLFKIVCIVIQPMAKSEGGLTQVESRVMRELALGAGAAKVVVWLGESLSDEGVRAKLRKT